MRPPRRTGKGKAAPAAPTLGLAEVERLWLAAWAVVRAWDDDHGPAGFHRALDELREACGLPPAEGEG